MLGELPQVTCGVHVAVVGKVLASVEDSLAEAGMKVSVA